MNFSIKKIFTAILFSFTTLLCLNAVENENTVGVERYALFIGSNIGSAENQTLLYAASDALSIQKTMKEIGGVSDTNSILLYEPTKSEVDDALNRISKKIEKDSNASRRSEFIFYYSGHSDEDALLLGKNRYDYSQLKQSITNVPSDVHVVILDSCYSGNFIRAKGGQMKKSFLVDESSVVKGHAYLSSSSSAEVSQESDEIGSSFFTNAIVTGLRGAADTSGDKKVSLNELYTYAFNETLVKTESSSEGPQHPNYNITLVGSGDLILSDISSSDSYLMIPKDVEGKIIIKDKNDRLVSEINKSDSTPISLSLEADVYIVTVITEYATFTNKIKIDSKSTYVLDTANFKKANKSTYRSRGGSFVENDADNNSVDATNTNTNENADFFNFNTANKNIDPLHLSLCGENIFFPKNDVNIAAALVGSVEKNVYLLQYSPVFNMASNLRGVQGSGVFNMSGDVLGIQGSGVFNIADDLHGIQGSGVFNIADVVQGIQGSGVFNIAGNVSGVQGSGVFNISNNVKGVQGSGVFNIAKDVQGIQGSGVFNIAGNVSGIQASGIFNYAKNVKGLQLGLVNISNDCDGVMIGLFNYCKNGIRDLGVSYNSDRIWTVEFKNGTKGLYSDISYSAKKDYFNWLDSMNKPGAFCSVNFGLGHRAEIGILYFDTEIMQKSYFIKDYEPSEEQLRILREFNLDFLGDFGSNINCPTVKCNLGIELGSLRIFGGASLDFIIKDYNDLLLVTRDVRSQNVVDFGQNVKGYVSYEVGASFKF